MNQTARANLRMTFAVLADASKQYGRNLVTRMAAAISYRTVFAIAPLLVVAVSIAGFFLGSNQDVQADIVAQINDVFGAELADFVDGILDQAFEAAATAAVVGITLLLWSSSTLFLELQRALNQIFSIPIPEEKRLFVVAIQRLVGVVWTVGFGIALAALFFVGTAVQVAGDAVSDWLNLAPWVVNLLGYLVTFGFTALMFGLVFQTLTFAKVPWRPIWLGAVFTAIIFTIAGLGTGLYFRLAGQPTALGVASSIVVLLFVAYLLSAVFLFGAQVTDAYWRLVYQKDQNYLLFSSDSSDDEDHEDHSEAGLSIAALGTFLIGLMVGRSSRR